jgi:glycerophosphoryl diester phosphodiesterase
LISIDPTVKRPLLLGHRGCRGCGFIENSLAAFEYALNRGCEGYEFDVRHTRDHRNVIWHDPDYRGRQIAAADYADLVDRGGNLPATFEAVLAQFGHRAYLDIELKISGAEEAIVAALKSNPPQGGFIFSSFLQEILLRLHHLDGSLPLGLLCEDRDTISAWKELPLQAFLPRHDLIERRLVDQVHHAGRQIMTWTVNSPGRMRQLAEWGIDGLISDDPQLLYQTFHIA